MNYTLHIPRPSLSGSSTSTRSGSSVHSVYSESNSYLPVGIHTSSSRNLLINNQEQQHNDKILQGGIKNSSKNNIIEHKNERRNSISTITLDYDCKKNQSGSNNNNNNNNRKNRQNKKYQEEKLNKSLNDAYNNNNINIKKNYGCDIIGQLKRGSRSSQGSTDSNHSAGTNSSGSLLLTTANLERFVAIHNNNNNNVKNATNNLSNKGAADSTSVTGRIATTTDQLRNNSTNNDNNNPQNNSIYTITNNHINKINEIQNNGDNINTMIEIDPNLHFIKTKDVDAVSIASSTHFTMVNGIGGPQRKNNNSGICRRGHQLTVLILTMSGFFLIGILLMVYLMEMRARDMPQM